MLLAISNIATSHVSFASSKSHSTRSRALSKTKMDFTLIKRVFSGIGQAIMGANQALIDKFFKILGCFKGQNNNKPTTAAGGTGYEIFDKTIDGIVKAINWVMAFPKAIMGYICKFKKNIVQYISKLFAMKRLRKYRRMMENGKSLSLSQLRRFRLNWSLLGGIKSIGNAVGGGLKAIGSGLASGANAIGAGLKYVGGAAWELAVKIIGPFLQKHWATIKSAMIAIRDSFFGEDSFVGKLVSCAQSLSKDVYDSIKAFFDKLKERYLRYKGIYGLGLPYITLYGANMLFDLVCDATVKTQMTTVAKAHEDAQAKKDKREETIQGGKIFGYLMSFSTNYRSEFHDTINKALEAQKKG
jgi:hypothetical protein